MRKAKLVWEQSFLDIEWGCWTIIAPSFDDYIVRHVKLVFQIGEEITRLHDLITSFEEKKK